MIKKAFVILITLYPWGMGMPVLYAQDFRECQQLFDKVLTKFNQSFEENNPRILQSNEYRRDLMDLQKAYKQYHSDFYSAADTSQRITNEAMLTALTGNYSKSLRIISTLDTLDEASSYYQGLIYLLNHNYSAARSILVQSSSRQAPLNVLVTYGQSGKITDGIQFAQSAPMGGSKGKWNYNLGLLYKQNQQLEEAVGQLTTAIRQKDEGLAYRLLRGDVLMELKQSRKAVADFEKVAKKSFKGEIRYGNALLDLGRFKEAKEVFDDYLALGDVTFRKDAYLGLGHALYGLQQLDESYRYYRLAATQIRDSPVALCGQANVLVSRHDYRGAQVLYERILQFDSTYVSAYLGRGMAHYGQRRYGKALSDFKRSEGLFDASNKALADIFVSRGFSYYHERRAGDALADFETAVRIDGARYEAWAGMSSIMIDQKSYSEAGKYLSKALSYEKYYDKMWSNYGNLLLHFDMYTKSFEVFKKAVTLNPQNVKAQNGWGIVLLENDKLDKSKILFDSLVKANPTIPYLLNNRGIVNAYHGNRYEQKKQLTEADAQYQVAFNDFKQAMQVAPSRKFYNVNQGNVYRYWEKYDEAKQSYETYQDKSAINNTGVLYAGINKMKDAHYYLDVALQLDSAHHVFQFNMNLLQKGKQAELARAVASAGDDGPYSDIGIKYSRDGFVTIYLYDYEYDTLQFPGRHYLPLPVAEYSEEYFIPEFDFKLQPYSKKKKVRAAKDTPSYKSQKVKMKRRGRSKGTDCPVF